MTQMTSTPDRYQASLAGLPDSPAGFGHLSLRQLWRLMNAPRPIDGRTVSFVLGLLLAVCVVAALARHDPTWPMVTAIRVGLCIFVFGGVLLARKPTWRSLRLYSVALAILLPPLIAWLNSLYSSPVSALVMTVLGLLFTIGLLLTPVDILIAQAANIFLFWLFWDHLHPAAISSADAMRVLAGGLAASAGMAVVFNLLRAGLNEGRTWWRQACERERALRELAQLAVSTLAGQDLFAEFARIFAGTCPGSRCVIVIEDDDGGYSVAAAAGLSGADGGFGVDWQPSEAFLRALEMLGPEQPSLVCAEPLAENRERVLEGFPRSFARTPCLVLLPISVDRSLSGAALLARPRSADVPPEDLLLWQAMANQIGLSLARSRLVSRLQNALAAKSEFVNTMSHELRSPLNVIIGYAEMLASGGIDVAFVADRLRRSGLELLQLVENTMTAARLGAGRVVVHPQRFAVADLFEELVESVSALPEANGKVGVEWRVAPDLGEVTLDRLKVKEIVQNLVSNGLKYGEKGVVRVEVGSEGSDVIVSVRDQGPGIPAEALDRIFEMFERLEPSDKAQPSGVGLGLFIVKSLVDLMQGSMRLVSDGGEGTCFTVRLPRHLDLKVLAEVEKSRGATNIAA